jgi:uncharacterized repeat protein (TIGR03803 family)
MTNAQGSPRWAAGMITAILIVLAAAIAAPAQTFTTIYNFTGPDGNNPLGSLVQATNGDLYGTTVYGGTDNDGVIFNITPGGTLTTVASFNGTNGNNPYSGPIQVTDGSFWGTTNSGGSSALGSIFRLSSAGIQEPFSFQAADGTPPQGSLVQGSDGNFYGTTFDGGRSNQGTVFRVTPSGKTTTIYSFCTQATQCADGQNPVSGLVQGSDGDLYGMTNRGGDESCQALGYLGCGAVFKVTLTGTETTLHQFNGNDGAGPVSTLVQGTDGNFYGTTQYYPNVECTFGCGTIFSMTPSGTLTTLHSFCPQPGCPDGNSPVAGLVQDTDGTFYGTTTYGGTNNDGTIYSLDVGLGPFVKTNPVAAMPGKSVKILGTNLTGATSVTFNGTAATFAVVSATEILTTVPAGATTGAVQVVTPSGTLTSNVNFQVEP